MATLKTPHESFIQKQPTRGVLQKSENQVELVKLKRFSHLGFKILQFLFMKRLTFLKQFFFHRYRIR